MRRMIPTKFVDWIKSLKDKIVGEDSGVTIGGTTAVENLYIQGEVVDENNDEALEVGTSDISISKNVNVGNVGSTKNLYVSGDITGGSIVETMTGYSASPYESGANTTLEHIYAGIVKNGNKLTAVSTFNITRVGSSEGKQIIAFSVPDEVLAKLYPVEISGYNFLAYSAIYLVSSALATLKVDYYVTKSANGFNVIMQTGNLTANTKYYARIELTFLLSDNLAS